METHNKYVPNQELFSTIKKILADQRQALFTVTGMSMWPFLCHGRDQVIVEKVKMNELKMGDIVLFQPGESKYILHRITKLEEHSFQTTGDGNLYRDIPMSYDQICAKVVKVKRKGKIISCDNWIWKISSWIWMKLFPVRNRIFQFYRMIRKK